MRATFFEEQSRYRRATWRWTMLATAAAVSRGLPLSVVLTPVAYLVALVTLRLISGVVSIPPAIWTTVDGLAALIPTAIDAYQRGPQQVLNVAVPLALVLLLPGTV